MLIPLKQQLKDPLFRKWMMKIPKIKVAGSSEPWCVYVQKSVDGAWARKLFPEYRDAYRFVALHINDFPDLTLNSRRQLFKPPIIIGPKGKLIYHLPNLPYAPDDPHRWCPYCRRLTMFKPFAKHHALNGMLLRYIERCVICGIPSQAIRRYT
jgi:hypothetical protein